MTTTATDEGDDFLDGMCDLDFVVEYPTPDEEAPYVALFCDVLDPTEHVRDRAALEHEAAEWHALFDQEAG